MAVGGANPNSKQRKRAACVVVMVMYGKRRVDVSRKGLAGATMLR